MITNFQNLKKFFPALILLTLILATFLLLFFVPAPPPEPSPELQLLQNLELKILNIESSLERINRHLHSLSDHKPKKQNR